MDLAALGWDSEWALAFAEHAARGWVPARVVNEDKHAYIVVGEAGEFPATIAGKIFHTKQTNADLPKVGDWVACQWIPGESKGVIQGVLPRRTFLMRQNADRATASQVVAVNVDMVFIVQALDQSFSRRRLERFLVMVHEGGARPVVVLNKCDLREEIEGRAAEAAAAAGSAPVIVTSARTGKGLGLLREQLVPRQTVCFVGTSGVGKSSLVNRLYGERVQETLPVREEDSKGRHSTTRREILPLPNGTLVVDTPGMREFQLWLVDTGLEDTFPELVELARNCRFRDCTHQAEPGCAVKLAVEKGKVPADRYQSFLKLQSELQSTTQRKKDREYQRHRHRERTGTKAYLDASRREAEG